MSKRSAYWIECDSCGRVADEYETRRVADSYYKTQGWIVNNYRDVCPSCQEKNK